MTKKGFPWESGVTLDEHSARKHKVLKEYLRNYLVTRCSLPQRERFRIAIVDGFCGAGTYTSGDYGSPLLFIDTLTKTFDEISTQRAANGMKPIEMECLFIFNDLSNFAILELKASASAMLAEIRDSQRNLSVEIVYFNDEFETAYPRMKALINQNRYGNVLFNLDQESYAHVSIGTLGDIMRSWPSVEVFLTFMIGSYLSYKSPNPDKDSTSEIDPTIEMEIKHILDEGHGEISKKEWLGSVEKIVFNGLHKLAPFVSPFSINNPDGWRYWLMHFSNVFRARQVYNNILHENSTAQAHFGRLGLNMLSYDPSNEGALYLFDAESREQAKIELHDDIPRVVAEFGDMMIIEDFYAAVYNQTAAHSDDIHSMMIENPDIAILTETGGERRSATAIKPSDIIKVREQKSFFTQFSKLKKSD